MQHKRKGERVADDRLIWTQAKKRQSLTEKLAYLKNMSNPLRFAWSVTYEMHIQKPNFEFTIGMLTAYFIFTVVSFRLGVLL